MKTVAIIGAGGKMGARAAAKLTAAGRWRLLLCESDPRKAAGLDITPTPEAMQQADRLMLPRHLYQLGIEAEVTHGPRSYDIVFGKRIDPTPGFDLIDFSIFEASPE